MVNTRSIKERLAEYGQETSRWVKETVVETSDGGRKLAYEKRQFLQVDTTLVRKMLESLTFAANKIAFLIMDEADYYNIFSGTYEEIQEKTNVGRTPTIHAMGELQRVDFIRKKKNGRWMLNPACGIRCGSKDRQELMDRYFQLRVYEKKGKDKDADNGCS